MKEHPILFSGEMVRAILDGRKTMTRRVLGNKKICPCDLIQDSEMWDGKEIPLGFEDEYGDFHTTESMCPYGQPGDRLWVRETFTQGQRNGSDPVLFYRATSENEVAEGIKWKPSIFMPRKYSRITLEITEVRAERLQDITALDIEREGAISQNTGIRAALDVWIKLWDSINAKRGYGWDKNPWVWVISFRRIAP